jgi:sulfhydrogenase subunit beta (sulfur reductase)
VTPCHLPRAALENLVAELRGRGYAVIGPVARDGAVVYDEIASAAELPVGLRDRQAPGAYRLESTGSPRAFDVVNGPGSLKRFFFAPREPLLQIDTGDRSFTAREILPAARKIAVLAARACDLAALAMQDRIFLGDRFPDPWYAARRRDCFLVAVSCTHSAPTCFCASMGTGPEATQGFDLALTEFDDGFLARAATAEGEAVLDALGGAEPPAERVAEERAALDACAAGMRRQIDTSDLPGLLYENLEHPRWDDVAERCLSCGNCTMVCPTCFCHDERDEPSVTGDGSVRVREWDSCFNREHAQVHGANFRPQIRDRYRQWLVHKLASWIDQFGSSGCVGCGRCITWCPVGIDLTEEVAAIRGGTR